MWGRTNRPPRGPCTWGRISGEGGLYGIAGRGQGHGGKHDAATLDIVRRGRCPKAHGS